MSANLGSSPALATPMPPSPSPKASDNFKRKGERPEPLPNALAFRVDEVPRMGGPGRTKLYELAASGKLKLIRVHGRTLVCGDSLRALLRNGTTAE
jgi:hypothetical protein